MDVFKFLFNKRSPKDVAKDRLKLILIHDRSEISPEILNLIKNDIVNVISKYVEVDKSDLEVSFTSVNGGNGDVPALVANIPIKKMKVRR